MGMGVRCVWFFMREYFCVKDMIFLFVLWSFVGGEVLWCIEELYKGYLYVGEMVLMLGGFVGNKYEGDRLGCVFGVCNFFC